VLLAVVVGVQAVVWVAFGLPVEEAAANDPKLRRSNCAYSTERSRRCDYTEVVRCPLPDSTAEEEEALSAP